MSSLEIHVREHEGIREEILLRLKAKNLLSSYVLALIGATVAGFWKFPALPGHTSALVILLFVIPFLSMLIAFMYNWHDIMIAALAAYQEERLIPRIRAALRSDDIYGWNEFLRVRRKSHGWKVNAHFMRLIFISPIPTSVFGYFLVIGVGDNIPIVEVVMLVVDLILLGAIITAFSKSDSLYREVTDKKIVPPN